MDNPVKKFDELVGSATVVFLVYYRGCWCPFCMSYLKKLQSIKTSIEKSNGVAVAVTAQATTELADTRKASGYHGIIINDPKNILAAELKQRNVLDVVITEKKGYSHGMAQPAVLVLRGEETLYQWAIEPSLMNFGGAKDRPLLDQVWANIQSQLQGREKVFQSVQCTSMLGLCREKIFG